ncbi:hypothetical protein ACQ4M3_07455 [Leptolyngbya sp. AN03gr2]|uniref:hypothetical protein n=1 Tax=unclassified Leptolyngbya TaxID=2650499 RepID=UPI003D31FA2E
MDALIALQSTYPISAKEIATRLNQPRYSYTPDLMQVYFEEVYVADQIRGALRWKLRFPVGFEPSLIQLYAGADLVAAKLENQVLLNRLPNIDWSIYET